LSSLKKRKNSQMKARKLLLKKFFQKRKMKMKK
jgi:hypothetical protein